VTVTAVPARAGSPALAAGMAELLRAARPTHVGRVRSAVGLSIEVTGLPAAVGEVVTISSGATGAILQAEVVAVAGDAVHCMPLAHPDGLRAGDVVHTSGTPLRVPVGEALLGRVLDGLGRPLDGLGRPDARLVEVGGEPPPALDRGRVRAPLTLGVRALDTLVPAGRGQRFGLFAGSGVGKSSLLSMIARGTTADVSVLALVGERGREVREFIEDDLGPEGLRRSVVVVATSDQPPLVRLRAAWTATRIAEAFRDRGRDVVLMMDSLTRVAMAQREIGLSTGEPPATRGYPPSVFAMLPRLLERTGPGVDGTITGIYTVLVEGDDHNEPIADAARSILDGHVVLDRRLATSGHYPSIDVLESVSRVAGRVTTPQQRADATSLRRMLGALRDVRDLLDVGAYVPGNNPLVDHALVRQDAVNAFLRQDVAGVTTAEESWTALRRLVAGTPGAAA
jgi:flagellum-specific ATP synthase